MKGMYQAERMTLRASLTLKGRRIVGWRARKCGDDEPITPPGDNAGKTVTYAARLIARDALERLDRADEAMLGIGKPWRHWYDADLEHHQSLQMTMKAAYPRFVEQLELHIGDLATAIAKELSRELTGTMFNFVVKVVLDDEARGPAVGIVCWFDPEA